MVSFDDDNGDIAQRPTLPIETARAAFDSTGAASPAFLHALQRTSSDVDVHDVEWLLSLSATLPPARSAERFHVLRICSLWAEALVSRKPRAGEAVPLRFDMIENAVTLLLDESVQDRSIQERVSFLLDKGVTVAEVRYACAQCSLEFPEEMDVDDSGEMVLTGANFLLNDAVRHKPLQERLAFLMRRGLTEAEIRKACAKAGVEAPPALPTVAVRAEYVEQGAAFLGKPAAGKMKADEQVDFLQSKDLSNDEIEAAFKRAGLASPGLPLFKPMQVDVEVDAAKVKDAVAFLADPNVQRQPLEAKKEFLKKKGLKDSEIAAALAKVEPAEEEAPGRPEMVAKAVTFFKHPRARRMKEEERERYLRSKGLSAEEIQAAREKVKGGAGGSGGKLESAVAFFKHPAVRTKTTREKIAFLKQKGFSMQEIQQAAQEAGVQLSPSAGLFVNETSGQVEEENAAESKEEKQEEPSMIERVARFLGDKTSAAQPLEDRLRYLQRQGVGEEDLIAGASKLGMQSAVKAALESLAGEASLTEEERASKRRVQQGTLFLQNKQTKLKSVKDRVSFLEKQGLDEQEILRAFIRAGVEIPPDYAEADPNLREEKVEMAARFLQNEKVKHRSEAQKIQFLAEQGISASEIDAAAARLGIKLSKEQLDPEVEKALNFLLDDRVRGQSTKDKVAFLRQQGIPIDKVTQAFKQAGLSMTETTDEAGVLQAVRWLLDERTKEKPPHVKLSFLRSKGLTVDQLREAFKRAGLEYPEGASIPAATRPMRQEQTTSQTSPGVQRAVEFLGKTQDVPVDERIEYLRSKNVSEPDIREALRRANVRHPEIEARQALVNQAVSFLMDDRSKGQPLRDRFEFLLGKGLKAEEILRAAEKTGTDFKGIPALLKDLKELEPLRHAQDAKLSVNGELLVKAMNRSCDILQSSSESRIVLLAAKGLLAITLCRLTVVDPPVESFVYGLKVLQRSQGDACASDGTAFEKEVCWRVENCNEFTFKVTLVLQAREMCIEYIAEFTARTEQVYSTIGDESNTYVNMGESLQVVLATFPSTPDYACGVALARSFHGKYSMIAATLSFTSTAQPAVRFLVVSLEDAKMQHNPTVAYITAGMLRGASDYAWCKDLTESPQPRLQKAMRRAAKIVNQRYEGSMGEHTVGSAEHLDAMEVVVAVGLACIYADSHVEWNQEVWKAAVEGLLSGALRCPSAFEQPGQSLHQRAAAAKDFLSSELFGLAAPILTKVVAELQPTQPLLFVTGETKGSSRAGVAWVAGRLFRYARGVYLLCRRDAGLANELAHRVVSYTYGEQEQDQEVDEGEDKAEEFHQREDKVVKEEVEEDAEEDSDESDVEEAEHVREEVKVEEDPLDEYLRELAPLARILHMCYLSVVLIGGKVAPSLRREEALALWDAMAYLAAFQVRVPETVELEDWLVALLQLEDAGPTVSSVVAGYLAGLLSDLTDEAGELKEGLDVVDWVIGARVEHLLRTGEEQLLPALKCLANRPANELKSDGVDRQFQRNLDLLTPIDKLGNGLSRCKELVKSKGFSESFFATRLRSILVDLGVKHRLKALNVRAHQWVTGVVAVEDDTELLSEAGEQMDILPYKFAIVPSYVDACIHSFPGSTSEDLLSFAFGSVLTSCASSGDIQAQALALVVFDALCQAAAKAAKEAGQTKLDVDKKRGITFYTLLFTCLKALPLPALEQSLEWYVFSLPSACMVVHQRCRVKDVIESAKAETTVNEEKTEEAGDDQSKSTYVAPLPFSRDWLITCLYGVIQRTGDTGRRKLLALWFLQFIHAAPIFAARL